MEQGGQGADILCRGDRPFPEGGKMEPEAGQVHNKGQWGVDNPVNRGGNRCRSGDKAALTLGYACKVFLSFTHTINKHGMGKERKNRISAG